MNIKRGFILIILILGLIFISGCNESNDGEESPTESPIQTIKPADPTPTPFQLDNNYLVITKAELISENEDIAMTVYSSQLNCHAGKAILRLSVNRPLTEDVIRYLSLNEEPVDPQVVTFGKNSMSIYLNDSLPYLFTFKIKTSEDNPHDSVKMDYSLELLQEAPLKYTISYYDIRYKKNTPQARYISEKNPTFLVEFSKPVKRDTLELARSNSIISHTTSWLSDTEVLVTLNNLNNGSHTLGISSVEGQSDIYGNTLSMKTTYSEVTSFQIADPQIIYSVIPEENKVEIIGQVEYGTFYESISNDCRTLTLGIISEINDDYSFSHAFYDLKTNKLTPFSSFIDQAISDAYGQQINIMDSMGYHSDDNRNYWDNDGNYLYGYEGSLYSVNPKTLKAEILFRADDDLFLGSTYLLENGNFAAINRPFNTNELLGLVIFSPEGDIVNKFELPFRELLIGNYMYYVTIINDLGDGTMLVCGFEQHPESGYSYRTLRMNIEDGSFKVISENSLYVGFYPELGYGFYYNYTDEGLDLAAVSFEGETLNSVHANDTRPRSIVYNPVKNVFYMLKYDLTEQASTIMILDAETFEISDTSLQYDNYVHMMGITEEGELLVMHIPGS